MRRIPPDDPHISCENCIQLTKTAEAAAFGRPVTDSPYHVDSPGTCIRFRTDARSVRAHVEFADKATLATHNACSSPGACRIDGVEAGDYTRPGDAGGQIAVSLEAPGGSGDHEYEIFLPYADTVRFLGVEIDAGASLLPVVERTGPRYAPYGDSITQGFWASGPLRTYAHQVAETHGWRLLNMGFAGRWATAADGIEVARLRPDLASILIGVNDCLGGVALEDYRANVAGIIANIRASCPDIPIHAITPLNVPGRWPGAERLEAYREQVRMIAATSGDVHLHVIEGPALIPSDGAYFSDGLHPNDAGFALMATNLAQLM